YQKEKSPRVPARGLCLFWIATLPVRCRLHPFGHARGQPRRARRHLGGHLSGPVARRQRQGHEKTLTLPDDSQIDLFSWLLVPERSLDVERVGHGPLSHGENLIAALQHGRVSLKACEDHALTIAGLAENLLGELEAMMDAGHLERAQILPQ